MPRYTVELDGQRVVLEGNRPPTEQEVRSLLGTSTPRSPVERTESRIAQRESLVPTATAARAGSLLSLLRPRETAQRNIEEFLLPLKGLQRRGQAAALQAGAGQELVESATASPIVSAQAKRPIFKDLGQVLRGQRVVERGDIARNVGAPEPLAAMFGLVTSPETDIPAAVGAVKGVQAVGRGVSGIQEAFRLGRPATVLKPNPLRAQTITHIQERLLRTPKIAGRQFEKGVEDLVAANPAQVVDLSPSLGSYLEKAKNNPAFKTLIERQALNNQESKVVKGLLANPATASNLTLKDAQTVKQIFQRVNKQRFNQVDPEFIGAHLDALEVWHDIRLAQLQAFPQFKYVLKGYNEVMQNFRAVKKILKDGALEPQLLKDLSLNSQQIAAFRELATPDTLKLVTRFLKSNATRSFLTRLGVRAGKIGVAGAVAGAGFESGRALSRLFGISGNSE